MAKSKKINKILPIFIPFLGCKNRCIYCNQNSITGISIQGVEQCDLNHEKILSDLKEQFKIAVEIYGDNYDEVAYYGGTFGELSSELRSELYTLAKSKYIRVSTSPVEKFDSEFLCEIINHISTVELGVQSLSDSVLKRNGRRYICEDVINSFLVLNRYVKTCAQFMVGMYTEEVDDIIYTASMLSNLKPAYVRIYPTIVLKNTILAELCISGAYSPLSATDTILRVAWIYIEALSIDAEVIRIGLPADITTDDVLSGYWHPALGDIVKTLVAAIYIAEYSVEPNFQYPNYNGVAMEVVKELENSKLLLQQEKGIDTMRGICKAVKEVYCEGKQWFAKEQVTEVAKRLIS